VKRFLSRLAPEIRARFQVREENKVKTGKAASRNETADDEESRGESYAPEKARLTTHHKASPTHQRTPARPPSRAAAQYLGTLARARHRATARPAIPSRGRKRIPAMSSQEACCGTMFWVYLMSCAGLVMFAGLMSGLTLGLMSLSIVDLEVLSKAGTPQDRRNAGTPSCSFSFPSPNRTRSPTLAADACMCTCPDYSQPGSCPSSRTSTCCSARSSSATP
jgi:hypothetical protein